MDSKLREPCASSNGYHQCGQSLGRTRDSNHPKELESHDGPHTDVVIKEKLQHLVPAVNEALDKMNQFYEQENWERATLYACLAMGRLQYLTELMTRLDLYGSLQHLGAIERNSRSKMPSEAEVGGLSLPFLLGPQEV
jgi:hypothetical protein